MQRSSQNKIITASSMLLAAVTVLSTLGEYDHICEILSHFVLFYFFILCAILAASLHDRLLVSSGVAAVALCLNIGRLVPQFMPISHQPTANAECTRIITFNCEGKKNKDTETIYKIACQENADIVCFSEIDDGWKQSINSKFKDYPYKVLFSSYGGIGLVSKLPLLSSNISLAEFRNRPRVFASIKLRNGETLALLTVHPAIPLNSPAFAARNRDFALYAKEMADLPSPKMIIGDLNCTPWSYYFKKLCDDTGLVDAERGFGPQCTWCYKSYLPPILPIDLCLLSHETVVTKVKTEDAAGSDHRPLFVEIWTTPSHH